MGGGSEPSDGAFPPLPPLADDSGLPALAIHLDVPTGRLAFRLPGAKRWHGNHPDMDHLMHAALAAGAPTPCILDFVEQRS